VKPESRVPRAQALTDAEKKVDVGISTLGIGVSWYFTSYNIYLSPVISFSVMEYDGPVLKGDSEGGGGFGLSVGKEWWVSDNWGLGVALYVYSGSDTVKEKSTGITSDVKSSIIGLMFTATYN
jgi:hypothetical protein